MTAVAERPETAPTAPRGGRGVTHVLVHAFIALVSAAGVAAVYWICVRHPLGQVVDSMVMNGADLDHPRVVSVLRRALNGTTLVSLVAVCLAAATIGIMRRRKDLAAAAALLVLGANATSQLLKSRLTRPDLDGFDMPNSFPSGHTTAAASVAFALILVLPFAIRGTVALAGAAYVLIIAVATIWAGWHRPSDTIAALLVVLAWGALASALVRAGRVRITGVKARPNRYVMLLFAVAGGISGVLALLGLGAIASADRVGRIVDYSGRFAFLAGAFAVAAAVAVTFTVWVRLAAGDRSTSPDGEPIPASAHSGGL
ncbi:phosphatase PAP2 family protein [Symbioplanes lichenis]|uniref:phosphatase PAP2 family protein n=1 Tax=Symbioplanes lichenis TaxID=1629072 RepID=UPI002738E32A|nr:phosphatase PAP2 family protein [Actinoplanes lichenis]